MYPGARPSSFTAVGPFSSRPAVALSCVISDQPQPSCWRVCWCSVSWEDGFWPVGCSPPSARITDATRTAASGSLSHRIRLPGRSDEFHELADAFDAMLARLEAHVAEQQRFAANASHQLRTPLAITQTLLEVARNDPNRGSDELVDRLLFVNARAIDLTEALLVLSRADQRSFSPERIDLSLIAEEATEALLPLAEMRGVTIETSGQMASTVGSEALLLQLATNLVHNAIVHNLPEQGTVWVTTSIQPDACGAHCREHRREAHPTVGLHPGRTVSAWYQTDRTPTTQVSALGWPSSRASPRHTTGLSSSPLVPLEGSPSPCSCPPRHSTRHLDVWLTRTPVRNFASRAVPLRLHRRTGQRSRASAIHP